MADASMSRDDAADERPWIPNNPHAAYKMGLDAGAEQERARWRGGEVWDSAFAAGEYSERACIVARLRGWSIEMLGSDYGTIAGGQALSWAADQLAADQLAAAGGS